MEEKEVKIKYKKVKSLFGIDFDKTLDMHDKFIKEVAERMDFVYFQQNKEKFVKLITDLKQENQALKDRWQKLKEWVERKYADNYIDANDTKSPLTAQEYYGGSADSCRKTLDKMQELEKEIR